MNSPRPSPEQQQQLQHLYARANGQPCLCRACNPPPRRLPSLVHQAEPFTEAEVRRVTPTLRARSIRGPR